MINRQQRAQEEVTILDMGIREEDRLNAAGNNVDDYIKLALNLISVNAAKNAGCSQQIGSFYYGDPIHRATIHE